MLVPGSLVDGIMKSDWKDYQINDGVNWNVRIERRHKKTNRNR